MPLLVIALVLQPAGLLGEALLGHEATLAALDSMSCELVTEYKNRDAKGSIPAKYWRSGGQVRTEYSDFGRKSIGIRTLDGALYSFGPSSGPAGKASLVISDGADGLSHGDAWRKGLLLFPGAQKRWETLRELTTRVTGSASTERMNGRDCILLSFEHNRAKLRIWLSRDHGYLATKLEADFKDSQRQKLSETVVDFLTVAPGVFFPRLVQVMVTDGSGAITSESTVAFTGVVLASPDEALLEPRTLMVPNCLVWDKIQRQRYELDQRGEKINVKAEQFASLAIPSVAPPYQATEPSAPQNRTWYAMVLFGSLVTIILGVALLILNRFRRAANPAG